MLLLHCSGRHFQGCFSARVASSLADIDLGCVCDVKGSLVEVLVCQAVASVGHMEGPKLIACYYFLLLHCSGELLLEDFLATASFSGGSFWTGVLFLPVRGT